QAAAKEFEEAMRLDPDWLPARINLGLALLNLPENPENHTRAISLFEDVLKRDPDNPYAHQGLGIILEYQTKGDAPLRPCEAVTRKDPEDAAAWFFLGRIYQAQQRPDDAIRCFEKALERDPYIIPALYGLAQLDPARKEMFLKRFEG